MKRITKQNLNDLANVMPVLSEQNQFENVGGTYYVSNLSFMELGYVGYGDEIYVANDFEWEFAQNNNGGGYGTPLAEADSSTQIRVWAQYVYLKNGFSGSITIEGNNSGFPVRFIDGTLYFNTVEMNKLTHKSTLEVALNSVDSAIRTYMAANGSGSNSGSTSGSASGSNSGNINTDMDGVPCGPINDPDAEISYILSRASTFNEYKKDITRQKLAERLFECWRTQGKVGMGYSIIDAYDKCKYDYK